MNNTIERLFAEALDRNTADRGDFLNAACRDAVQRAEMEALLADASLGDDLLRGAIGRMAGSFLPAAGARVGPWRLIEPIGEGGMGVVFLAERADGVFHQQVAIKFVNGGSAAMVRFQQERQILARLVHANIARLIDGGVTGDGTPYMVMEYFPGEPISRYCRERNVPVEQRLRLFQQVCSAVDYAHRNLTIHRDLKPSNILVNQQGEVKLLDFGIAKLLHPTPEETLTAAGNSFFTPDYASPEQIRGEPVTTATDVYSLGALLFELLSGAGPHRLTRYTPAEITQVICHDPAPPLGLGNELDAICAMALRKEPERRYASASHLSEDITHYLEQRPVLARPDTASYRVTKFMRRNRVSVGAGMVALLGLLAGLGLAVWQAQVARREAAEAQYRFQQVRKLARTVLFDLDERVRNVSGAIGARELLARTAVEYLDSLYSHTQNDPGLQRELAQAYERIADVQGEIGRPNLGQPQNAIRNYRRSVELWEGLAEPDRDETAYARALLKLHNTAGGRYLQRARAAAERARRRAPNDPATYALLIRLERVAGNDGLAAMDLETAIRCFRRAAAYGEEWQRHRPGVDAQSYLAGALESLVTAHLRAGDPLQALATAARALAMRDNLLRQEPRGARHTQAMVHSHLLRGHALASPRYVNRQRPEEAAAAYRQAIALAQRLIAEDPKNAVAKTELAEAYAGLAAITSEYGAARALQQQALSLFEAVHQGAPQSAMYKSSLARGHQGMAEIALRRGQLLEAERHLHETLRLHRSRLPGYRMGRLERSWHVAPLQLLVQVYRRLRQPLEAEAAGRELQVILESLKQK